jgi:hypothetical protein
VRRQPPRPEASGQRGSPSHLATDLHEAAVVGGQDARRRHPCGPHGLCRQPAPVVARRELACGGGLGFEVGAARVAQAERCGGESLLHRVLLLQLWQVFIYLQTEG